MKNTSLSQTTVKKNVEEKLNDIIIYALEECPYCKAAIKTLDKNKIKYNKIIVENDPKIKDKYKKQTSMETFPMIFIQNQHNKNKYIKLGGFSDLQKYLQLIQHCNDNDINIDVLHSLYQITE